VHELDYAYSDELQMVRETVGKFIENEVIPLEEELDPDAIELPREQVAELQEKTKAMGMFQLGVPVQYGGGGLDFYSYTVIMEEMSKHRQGLYNTGCGAFGHGVNPILYAGNEEQIENYVLPTVRGEIRGCFAITEPSGGSDPARAIRTRGVQQDGGWLLNGSKCWITHAGQSDYVTVFVRTDDGPVGERGEITCFIVETGTPGYTIGNTIPVIRPDAPWELIFDDCFVSDAQMLGERGRGFELLKTLLTSNRIPYAAQCIGLAQKALEMTIDYAMLRETFGKPLAQRQAVQWMLADAALEIHAARLVVLHAARIKEEGKPFHIEASMAKLHATEVASRVIDNAIQIHGGMGLAKELPLERWYRELRTRRIGEGPSEIHRMVIAREFLN